LVLSRVVFIVLFKVEIFEPKNSTASVNITLDYSSNVRH
jgi:hypothetical protein